MKNTEQFLQAHKLRLLRRNGETVNITLNTYHELLEEARKRTCERDEMISELEELVKNNGNYEKQQFHINYSDFQFCNQSDFQFSRNHYVLKQGINEKIDRLKEENKKLKDLLNKKLTFLDKIKLLFS